MQVHRTYGYVAASFLGVECLNPIRAETDGDTIHGIMQVILIKSAIGRLLPEYGLD